ncbi:MAG: hypothetical protein ACYDG4_10755 [Desulfuromonadaceae bacterium]
MVRLSLKEARALGFIPGSIKPKKPKRLYVSKAQWDARRVDGGIVLTAPENMPSLNEWKKWHWAKQKRYLNILSESLTALAMVLGRPRYEKARVEVVHYFRTSRRRDSGDNYAPKFILDALRYAGVLEEDNSEVLKVPEPIFRVDKECYRTEIWIYDNK